MDNPPGPPQPGTAQPANGGSSVPIDLRQLIADSAAQRPAPVRAHTYIRKWTTASKPVALKCDDGNVYVVKARQTANPAMHRAISNEQIVGKLGALIRAPIPPIAQVDVPAALIANQPEMSHMTPGLAHGSLFSAELSERLAISHVNVPGNRSRFALLSVLFGWVIAGDHQFFYTKSEPPLVYSVDHAFFFPGQAAWTIQSLTQAPQPQPDNTIVESCGLTPTEIHAALRELSATDHQAIACTVALPPDDWGVTMEERVALFEFLTNRRDTLLGLLPAGTIQGEHV